jgi:hypothetical protein
MQPIRPSQRGFSTNNKKGFLDFLKVAEETDETATVEVDELEVDFDKNIVLESGLDE